MADKQTWERKIIEAGYRELAKRHHPDRGGKPEDMAALNQAVTNLRGVDRAAQREDYKFSPGYVPVPGGPFVAAPFNPLDVLDDLADKVLEIIDKVSKPRHARRR